MTSGRAKRIVETVSAGLRRAWIDRATRYVAILTMIIAAIGNNLPFEPFDWIQKSITAQVNTKPYRGDAVVVAIDARTMEALGRTRFTDGDLARLIDALASAKPKRIVIGRIRQRGQGTESDPSLAQALAGVSPKPIQFAELVIRDPFTYQWDELDPARADAAFLPPRIDPGLAKLVRPANEVSSRSVFGAPWGLPPTIRSNGVVYPSIAQLMAGREAPFYDKFEIDMSYDPASVVTISAADILADKFDPRVIRDRQAVLSSTSNNPNEFVNTPQGQFENPAIISIFAAQTLIDGTPRMIGWIPAFLIAVIGVFAWLWLRPPYGRLAIVGIVLFLLFSPLAFERALIFQETSNGLFLILFVAIGKQWGKVRTTLALARSAADTKSWFLAQASHDLRQPIHTIGMLAARLAQTDLTPAQAELASKIDRSIEGANRMLQSLLDLATIESGSLKPKIVPVPVNALLAEVEEQNAAAAERAGVDLRFVPSEAVIRADRALAAAMLQNIVSNAIKYATGKEVLVGPRRSGKTLSLCVYDRGQGISTDDMRHVRKEFFRASSHQKKGVEGTGLGLAIVRRLANLLGLSFSLRSTPGKGTAAIIGGFRLTRAEVPVATAAQASVMLPLTGLHILLADDDLDALRATEALLEQWGCLVTAHDSFRETGDRYDVIVSDFDFGKGHTLADHRDTIDALARDGVPTIVLSGHHPDFVKDAMQRETLLVLAKPLRPAELRSVLMASRSAAAQSA